ncbi:unnamed protein product [Cuscuta epithymum]|uniref:TPX2 C-terminal domain-containing protein n=1 Tax=Cuscuta epithymum TaxID=186058 RepID=A0AAV0CTU1_9ASTE|nr:unnamed protein product [Cuscuta epithymum]
MKCGPTFVATGLRIRNSWPEVNPVRKTGCPRRPWRRSGTRVANPSMPIKKLLLVLRRRRLIFSTSSSIAGQSTARNLKTICHPRLADFESKYNESVDRQRAERDLTQEDELDSDADDEAAIEAAGVYKGRVPCLGAEGQRILYDRSTGASSSRSRSGEDPRMAQMQRELAEHERRWEEQRKREEETKARLEEMERFMRAGFQPPHQPFRTPYVFHHEQTNSSSSAHGRYGFFLQLRIRWHANDLPEFRIYVL